MALSNDAKCILHCTFFSDGTVLTMENRESRLSPRAVEAMTELIGEGIVEARKAGSVNAVSMSYSLTPKGQAMNRKQSQKWVEQHGNWSLTIKNT